MKFISFFAGIGGFDLGLERAASCADWWYWRRASFLVIALTPLCWCLNSVYALLARLSRAMLTPRLRARELVWPNPQKLCGLPVREAAAVE